MSPLISSPRKQTKKSNRSIAAARLGASFDTPRAAAMTPSQKRAYGKDGTPGLSAMTIRPTTSRAHARTRTQFAATRITGILPRCFRA
jgi:hypothetical protein